MRGLLMLLVFWLTTNAPVNAQQGNWNTHIEGGVLTYGPATLELGYSFRAVQGWSFYENFSAGLGIGYEKFMLNENDGEYFKGIPIFAQAKYVFNPEKRKSFYMAFDLGYSSSINKTNETVSSKESYKGGILASPQFGLLWYLNKRKRENFSFSIGYKYQSFKEEYYYNYTNWFLSVPSPVSLTNDTMLSGFNNYTSSKYHLHRISVMVGFGF